MHGNLGFKVSKKSSGKTDKVTYNSYGKCGIPSKAAVEAARRLAAVTGILHPNGEKK